jgi:hypothetical protein
VQIGVLHHETLLSDKLLAGSARECRDDVSEVEAHITGDMSFDFAQDEE